MSLILIVDDEFDVLSTYALLLQLEGLEAVTARHGKEALERIAERRPDLILTDYMMPVMNGLALCRHLRSDPALADIPIIMSSAVGSPAPGQGLYDDFYIKPVLFDALMAGMRRLLQQQQKKSQPPAPPEGTQSPPA